MENATSLKAIGARLLKTRTALELRAVDICRDLDIKANAYSQWESGMRRPNLDDMFNFANFYKVTLDWIYLGDPSGLPYGLAQKILAQTSSSSDENLNNLFGV